MTYLVHPQRNWRWKTLRVPVRKQLLSGKHVCSPQRNTPRLILCERQTLCVWMLTLSIYLLRHGRIFACILEFALFYFILYTTVILIASFAPVFNGNMCFGKQDDGGVALWALADIQGLLPAPGDDRVAWRSSKLEAERFKLGWMAGWEQSEDKDILNCTAGRSEKWKASCRKDPSREGDVSKHFLEILVRCQPPLSVPNVKTIPTAARAVHTLYWFPFYCKQW